MITKLILDVDCDKRDEYEFPNTMLMHIDDDLLTKICKMERAIIDLDISDISFPVQGALLFPEMLYEQGNGDLIFERDHANPFSAEDLNDVESADEIGLETSLFSDIANIDLVITRTDKVFFKCENFAGPNVRLKTRSVLLKDIKNPQIPIITNIN